MMLTMGTSCAAAADVVAAPLSVRHESSFNFTQSHKPRLPSRRRILIGAPLAAQLCVLELHFRS